MTNTVPPPTFQIIGAILVFLGALAALGTLAADHAYWQQLMQGSGKPRLPTNWLLIPIGERIVSLRHTQADPCAERLRLRAGRWWRATGVLLSVAFLYFVFVPPIVGNKWPGSPLRNESEEGCWTTACRSGSPWTD